MPIDDTIKSKIKKVFQEDSQSSELTENTIKYLDKLSEEKLNRSQKNEIIKQLLESTKTL
tara:strand:- start:444 stop:623 length:180 start_codon:yes stop_codon:yes gene_type:complete